MNNKPLILIVEDDKTISAFISAMLEANDYRILLAEKAQDALSMAASYCPDLILLDLGLPDLDGIDVLKKVRQWTGLPVIIVSARGQEKEKVEALDLGADDYITKPFGSAELLARIRTAMRHREGQVKGTQDSLEPLRVGDLEIDYARRIVSINEEQIHLTPIEYKLVVLLSKNLGRVMTYDAIMHEVWGPYINERQALRVNMANIRRKIEINPGEPRYIMTEVGVGYRMTDLI